VVIYGKLMLKSARQEVGSFKAKRGEQPGIAAYWANTALCERVLFPASHHITTFYHFTVHSITKHPNKIRMHRNLNDKVIVFVPEVPVAN
jgi:hypothetical protein